VLRYLSSRDTSTLPSETRKINELDLGKYSFGIGDFSSREKITAERINKKLKCRMEIYFNREFINVLFNGKKEATLVPCK